MSFKVIKQVQCDHCRRTVRVEDVAAPPLPKDWHVVADFYGNETHCCDRVPCMNWLREFSENYCLKLESVYARLLA